MRKLNFGEDADGRYKALGVGERTSKKVSRIKMTDGSSFKRRNANQYGDAEGGNEYVETRSNRSDSFDLGGTADSADNGANVGGTLGSSMMKRGGISDKKDKFIIDQISYVISLKSIAEKKNTIKNSLLPNIADYNLDEMTKKITKGNLEYALQQKSISNVNKVLKTSINALKNDKMKTGGGVNNEEINLLLNGYFSAVLFAETDLDTEESLDANYSMSDFDKETVESTKKMLSTFYSKNKKAIEDSGLDLITIGMDIWYTRAGHGAGFFDHSLDSDVEEKLTKGAKALGEYPTVETYDGKISIRGGRVFKGNGGGLANVPESFPETDAMSYGEGGGTKGYKLTLKSWDADVYEDDYNEGEGKNVNSFNEKVNKSFSSGEELLKYISDFVLYHPLKKEDYSIMDDGRIVTSVLVDEDNSSASAREVEEWKNGNKKLYSANYNFYVTLTQEKTPSADELSKLLGISVYKKGGRLSKYANGGSTKGFEYSIGGL